MSIAGLIHGYRSQVENIAYLNAVLAECPWPDLCDSLLELVKSKDGNNAASADLFIRDVFYRTNKRAEFRDHVELTGLPDAYRQNLFARNYYVRRLALGTLCTFDSWWSENDWLRARDFFEQNDPLSLSKLTTYVMRDSHWEDWSLPKRLADNPEFFTRWSVTVFLEQPITIPLPRPKQLLEIRSLLEILCGDQSEIIRVEADFLAFKLKKLEGMSGLSKSDKRKISKEITARTPKIQFEMFLHFVGGELFAQKMEDFTIADLHRFLDSFQKSR